MLIWLPSASPPVLYTAVGVYIKFYICRPLLHQPLPSTRGLQRVYSSTAVYRVYRYTGIQRSTVYSGMHSPSGRSVGERVEVEAKVTGWVGDGEIKADATFVRLRRETE